MVTIWMFSILTKKPLAKTHHNSSATAYLRDNFDDHVNWAKNNTTPFSKSLKDSIALCVRSRKTKAALSTYENMMEWHLQCNGQLKKTKRHLIADHM